MSESSGLYPGLVNFCTQLNDGPKDSDHKIEISESKKKDLEWLRMVLDSVETPERQIKRLLSTLEREDLTEEDCIKSLEELNDLVDDLNWATEFSLMDGHNIILKFLRDSKLAAESAEVRKHVGVLIAYASQLYERVQKCFEEAKWHEVLVPLLKTETSPSALAGLLYACCSLCREYSLNAVAFSNAGGIDVLSTLFQTYTGDDADSRKIIRRSLFLLLCLLNVTDVDIHFVAKCISMYVKRDDSDIQISFAQVFLFFLDKSPKEMKRVMGDLARECLERWRNESLSEDDARLTLLRRLGKQK